MVTYLLPVWFLVHNLAMIAGTRPSVNFGPVRTSYKEHQCAQIFLHAGWQVIQHIRLAAQVPQTQGG